MPFHRDDSFNPPVASNIGNNLSGVINLTVLPAGHRRGLYNVNVVLINRTAPATGTVTRSYGYSTPTVGATSAASTAAITITQAGHAGGTGFSPTTIFSDGTAAITLALTPASITGSPVTDIYASAELITPL